MLIVLKNRLSHTVFVGAILFLHSGMASAQAGPFIIPPDFEQATPEGIDLLSRNFTYSATDLQVGRASDSSSLGYRRRFTVGSSSQVAWVDNVHAYVSCYYACSAQTMVTVVYDDQSFVFNGSSTGFYSFYPNGTKLEVTSSSPIAYRFTAKDGTQITFSAAAYPGPAQIEASAIVRPDGSRTNLYYDNAGTLGGGASYRLRRVVNSFGYGFRISYVDNGTAGSYTSWRGRPSSIDMISTNCTGTGAGCSDTVLRTVSYRYPASGTDFRISQFVDDNSAVTAYTYAAGTGFSSISVTGPNSSSPKLTGRYETGKTKYITVAGTKEVSLSAYSGGSRTGTIINQENVTSTYATGPVTGPYGLSREAVFSMTDQNGYTTKLDYGPAVLPTKVTHPEDNAEEYLYDDRANVVLKKINPKPGSSLLQLSSSATYPATCDSTNFRICNKPTAVIDDRGNRTDYIWDPNSGNVLTETRPPDANGVRPTVSYGYSAFTGIDGATFWLLTSKTEKLGAQEVAVSTYGYDIGNHWALKEASVTAGSQTLRTCFLYDTAGNLISQTEPRALLTSCP